VSRVLKCANLGTLLAFAPCCGILDGRLLPETTSVRLVNQGDFDVVVELYIDDVQEIPREALTEFGTRMEFTIPPGEAVTLNRDCDELQAIVIDDADLQVAGQVGPETDTDVLRDGDDFGCGDTILFTFDHSPALLDFDVTVTVLPG
jgi:hypothetical protein